MKILHVFICLAVLTLNATGQIYDGLFRQLMKGYQKDVMPRRTINSTNEVKFNLQLIELQELNFNFQYLKTDVWMSTSWQDHRLVWNPAQYSGIEKMAVPPNKLWVPDITLYNGASGIRAATVRAVVYSDGNVFLIRPATIRSRCAVYPEGEPSTCNFKFGSWVHSGNELDLNFQSEVDPKVDLADYVRNLDYEIVNNTAVRNVVVYDCCPEPYIDLTYSLTIRELQDDLLRRRRRRRR